MKKAELDQEIGRIMTAIETLDPENENSIIAHLRSTSDHSREAISQLSKDLYKLVSHLKDPKKATSLLKAAAAFGELSRLPEWKKVEELSLLLRAAMNSLEDNINSVIEQEDS